MLVEPLWVAWGVCNAVVSGETAEGSNMKFKKFITIMQAAMGIVPLNKRELLPPGRKLWRPPGWVKQRCKYELVCIKWMFVYCLYVAFGVFKYKHLLYLFNIWIFCTSIQNVANIAGWITTMIWNICFCFAHQMVLAYMLQHEHVCCH